MATLEAIRSLVLTPPPPLPLLPAGAVESLLEGHSEAIRSVVLTYLGRFAVTASDDHTVRVWDTHAAPLKLADKHVGKVKQVRRGGYVRAFTRPPSPSPFLPLPPSFSPPLLVLLLSFLSLPPSLPGLLHCAKLCLGFYFRDGSRTASSPPPPPPPRRPPCLLAAQLRPLPGGRRVVSAGEDGLTLVWDAGSGAVVHTMSGHDDNPIGFLATTVLLAKAESAIPVAATGGGRRKGQFRLGAVLLAKRPDSLSP